MVALLTLSWLWGRQNFGGKPHKTLIKQQNKRDISSIQYLQPNEINPNEASKEDYYGIRKVWEIEIEDQSIPNSDKNNNENGGKNHCIIPNFVHSD